MDKNLSITQFRLIIYPEVYNILSRLSEYKDEYSCITNNYGFYSILNNFFKSRLNMFFNGINNDSYIDNENNFSKGRKYQNFCDIDIYTQIILDKYGENSNVNNNYKYNESEISHQINHYINNKTYSKIFNFASESNIIKNVYDKFGIIFNNFKINKVKCYYEMVTENIYYIVFLLLSKIQKKLNINIILFCSGINYFIYLYY